MQLQLGWYDLQALSCSLILFVDPDSWSCRAEHQYSHINEACRWEDGEKSISISILGWDAIAGFVLFLDPDSWCWWALVFWDERHASASGIIRLAGLVLFLDVFWALVLVLFLDLVGQSVGILICKGCRWDDGEQNISISTLVLYYTSCWDFVGIKIEIVGMDPNCCHPKPRPTMIFWLSLISVPKGNLTNM